MTDIHAIGEAQEYQFDPTLHVVSFTEKRIECDPFCPGDEPHLDEYRASDVNPNR